MIQNPVFISRPYCLTSFFHQQGPFPAVHPGKNRTSSSSSVSASGKSPVTGRPSNRGKTPPRSGHKANERTSQSDALYSYDDGSNGLVIELSDHFKEWALIIDITQKDIRYSYRVCNEDLSFPCRRSIDYFLLHFSVKYFRVWVRSRHTVSASVLPISISPTSQLRNSLTLTLSHPLSAWELQLGKLGEELDPFGLYSE